LLQERIAFVFETEQRFHFAAEVFVGAGLPEKESALGGRMLHRSPVQLFE
jgi:hypothetical protein